MANRFVHFNTKATFNTATLGTEYNNNSIVFIKDTQEIWTHGTFYAIPDSYKTKITSLETAVSALQEAQASAFAFKSVTDGTTTVTAASGKETITFAGGTNTSVTVDNTGKITIGSTLGANAYYPNDSGTALAERVATLETDVAKTVSGTNAINVTASGNTRTVALKLNNEGKNVTLSQTAEGLSAEVTSVDTLVPIDGIAASDKVLTLTNKKIGASVTLSVDSTAGSDGKKYIRLTGANNADLGKIDVAEFVKDGMLANATFNQTNHTLTLTFNTDSGKEAIDVDLSSLVDVYDGSTVKLKQITVSTEDSPVPAVGDSVDTVVGKLMKRNIELTSSISNVNTTVATLDQNVLKSVSKGTDGDFVTTTIGTKSANTQTIGVAIKTNVAVADATTSNNSLATSLAVKNYVDSVLAWAEY